jgi:hypothetical protein
MTKSGLNPDLRRTVEIIEGLGFGTIEGLLIRHGLPWFEPEPCVVQSIKLDSAPEQLHISCDAELTLKIEFERLFNQLREVNEGTVDIEVRHSAPFRLIVRRRCQELL